MAESRSQDTFLHLQEDGFDTYFPSQKSGECLEPYVVVKDDTSSKFLGYSSTRHYLDILCYMPQGRFSEIQPFMEQVKESMKKLYPMIRPTYSETTPYYDSEVNAYMASIQYEYYRKITL